MIITRSFLLCAGLSLAFTSTPAQTPPLAASPASAAAEPAPLIDYLKLPQYFSPRLSPNGKYLAVSTPVNGRLNLAIVELDTRKGTAVTNFSGFDVLQAVWVGNDRLVFTLGQLNAPSGFGQDTGGGLFMVSRDGRESRELSPTLQGASRSGDRVYRGFRFVRTIPGSNEEIMASARLRSEDAVDVYRLNIVSGRSRVVTSDRPARTTDFVLDQKLVPRIAESSVKDSTVSIIHYRSDENSPWVEIRRSDVGSLEVFEPVGFLADGKTMLVAANPGRDTNAIYRYDVEKRQFGEMLASNARYDLGGGNVVLEPETERLLGYSVNAERPQVTWLDEKSARTQALIDKALPGMVNTFRRFPNSSRLLVSSYSDVVPAKYFLLDEDKKTLEELFESKPWLSHGQLVQMRPFLLKTRDGLEIPSYYFLPKSYKPGDKLPTVVHIHGGPEVRADSWAFGYGYSDAEVLASRGYAVILPNYRITPGFGAKIHAAGFGALGRQMSDDHEDAAKWAVDQGFADPARMCVVGASYGGYATLRALAKSPGLFKCGVAGLPVTDWESLTNSPLSAQAYGPGPSYWRRVVGQDVDKTAFRDYSPVNMAEKIKVPVFLWEGTDDITTPVEQTYDMARALERAGNPAKTVLIKVQEGHGYGRIENQLDLYEKVLKFLDENIGSKRP